RQEPACRRSPRHDCILPRSNRRQGRLLQGWIHARHGPCRSLPCRRFRRPWISLRINFDRLQAGSYERALRATPYAYLTGYESHMSTGCALYRMCDALAAELAADVGFDARSRGGYSVVELDADAWSPAALRVCRRDLYHGGGYLYLLALLH